MGWLEFLKVRMTSADDLSSVRTRVRFGDPDRP